MRRTPIFSFSGITIHVFFLIAICFTLYYRHSIYLFEGYDARNYALLLRHYFEWTPVGLAWSWDPMQGMGLTCMFEGYTVYPFLTFILPISFAAQKIIYFTLCTVQMFLASYLLLWSMDIKKEHALYGSWACVMCVFPLQFQPVPLSQSYVMFVQMGFLYSTQLILLALYRLIGRRAGITNICVWAAFLATLFIQSYSSFSSSPAIAPVLLLGGLLLLFLSESRKEVLQKIAAPFVALFMLAVTGLLPWLFGQVMQSARYTLNAEFPDIHPKWNFASVLIYPMLASKFIIAFAFFGALHMLTRKDLKLRITGMFMLLYMALIAVTSYFYLSLYDMRSQLRPIYYEFAFMPFYAFSAVYAFGNSVKFLFKRVVKRDIPRFTATQIFAAASMYVVLIALSAFVFKKYRPVPPLWQETSITRRLVAETQLHPGSLFRGRSAWLTTWQPPDEPALSVTHSPDGQKLSDAPLLTLRQLDESHTALEMFLEYDIPTIECYNQSVSVPFYLVGSRLASQSPWGPNFTYFSKLNVPLLSAMGVRFVMASSQFAVPGTSLAAYQIKEATEPVGAGDAPGARPTPPPADSKGLFLYELANPNVGNYSPVEPTVVQSINAMLDIMGRPDFDFTQRVLLTTPLPEGTQLTRADAVSITVKRGGLHIRAKSAGTSLLLLPFEFMNAMRWVPDMPSQQPVRLYRANLVMTGLLFQGELSGVLDCMPPPLPGGRARLKDYQDMKALGLKDVERMDLHGERAFFPSFVPEVRMMR